MFYAQLPNFCMIYAIQFIFSMSELWQTNRIDKFVSCLQVIALYSASTVYIDLFQNHLQLVSEKNRNNERIFKLEEQLKTLSLPNSSKYV